MASTLIEDHALLSDQRTSALVTREGTIDWLCMPRFDAPAVFCSLLGDESHGHWTLRIADGEVVERRYLPSTMVLETTWRSPTGTATRRRPGRSTRRAWRSTGGWGTGGASPGP